MPSERVMVRLIANGATDQDIATATGQSLGAVKYRLGVLRQGLRARDRAHMVALALCQELISFGDVHIPAPERSAA
ncbi:hypothetical protein [Streptomyces triculaminicus]|uniref:hypothetical protein n=1 Tax=Streptomyces triculaminicus TaxID=2816232 RepID=UPI003790E2F7